MLDQELAVALPHDLLQLLKVLVVDPDPDVGVVDLDPCQQDKWKNLAPRRSC